MRFYRFTKYKADNLTESEAEQIIRQLEVFSSSDLYESNKVIMKMISDGFALKREDRSQKDIWIYLIDFNESNNNNYKIVRPDDLTITPKFNLSDKQKKEEFQNIDIQVSKNNFSCANKMLVGLIKMNFLYILNMKVVKLIYRNNLRFFITLIKKILLRNISREKFKL